MQYLIKIENGTPSGNPITTENAIMVWPDLDLDNLPDDLIEFVKVDRPELGPYEVFIGHSYAWHDNKVTDSWQKRTMTDIEKNEKIQSVQSNGFPSWIFNEETCSLIPPQPYPSDGKQYKWSEDQLSWTLVE